MEQPRIQTELTEEVKAALDIVRSRVLEEVKALHPDEADSLAESDLLFTYPGKEELLYTMTLDDAIKICGKYIAEASENSIDRVVRQIIKMYRMTDQVRESGELETSRERGRQYMAQIGIRSL